MKIIKIKLNQENDPAARGEYSTGVLLRRFLPYYRPYFPTLARDLACAGLTTVCELVLPMLVRRITNAAVDGTLTARLILISGGVYILGMVRPIMPIPYISISD